MKEFLKCVVAKGFSFYRTVFYGNILTVCSIGVFKNVSFALIKSFFFDNVLSLLKLLHCNFFFGFNFLIALNSTLLFILRQIRFILLCLLFVFLLFCICWFIFERICHIWAEINIAAMWNIFFHFFHNIFFHNVIYGIFFPLCGIFPQKNYLWKDERIHLKSIVVLRESTTMVINALHINFRIRAFRSLPLSFVWNI